LADLYPLSKEIDVIDATYEQWPAVVGWEQNYRVSSSGDVWSAPRATTRGGLLKQVIDKHGYHYVTLTLDGVQTKRPVHQLVIEAHFGPCPEGEEVRHLNGNPADNRWPENLAYSTHAVNLQDRREHGTDPNLNKTHCPKKHPYDEANTYWMEGRRVCLICRRATARRIAREKSARNRKVVTERPCEFCGTPFTPLRKTTARFCCRRCSQKAKAAQGS
jgi:HNH endonuclease/NUMOD4 motif